MDLPKSTYYFEIEKEDIIEIRNKELLKEITSIFTEHKGKDVCLWRRPR